MKSLIRERLDNQLLFAAVIGSLAIIVTVAVVSSFGSRPLPKSVKGDKLWDVGPRIVYIKPIRPTPPMPPSELTPESVVKEPLTGWLRMPLPVEWPSHPEVKEKPKDIRDICARHNMRKVWVNSKRWRCKK